MNFKFVYNTMCYVEQSIANTNYFLLNQVSLISLIYRKKLAVYILFDIGNFTKTIRKIKK